MRFQSGSSRTRNGTLDVVEVNTCDDTDREGRVALISEDVIDVQRNNDRMHVTRTNRSKTESTAKDEWSFSIHAMD